MLAQVAPAAGVAARILVVEDQDTVRRILRAALEREGFQIVEAASGAGALETLAAGAVDLVLLDLGLPDIEGLDLIDLLRGRPACAQLPIVVVSARHDNAVIARALESGADDYVVKPVDYPILHARIRLHLERRQAQTALQASREQLEQQVNQRTAALRRANASLRLEITERREAERALRASEERFASFFRLSPEAITITDLRSGRLLDVNEGFQQVTGHRRERVIGKTSTELGFWSVPERRLELMQALQERRSIRGWLVDMRHGSGDLRQCEISAELIEVDGAPCMLAVARDVTERRRLEDELRDSEQRLRSTFDNAAIPMALVNCDGDLVRVNRAFTGLTGHDEDTLLHLGWAGVTHPEDLEQSRARFRRLSARQDDSFTLEARYLHRSGAVKAGLLRVATVYDGAGAPSYFVAQIQDVTDERKLAAELSHQAAHDSLTGLVNRREFERRLQGALQRTRGNGDPCALAYLDLDQFKVINDTCGHTAGDELLRRLAPLLRREVGGRDTLARLGGDEFAVLLERCTMDRAHETVERLRAAITGFRFLWDGRVHGLGVSIGLVAVTADSGGMTEVMRQADVACYAAKEKGRNRVHLYRANDEELARRHGEMRCVAELTQAIEAGRIHLFYQPIAPLQPRAGEGLHYELLVRLKEESGRDLPPAAFLPAAERYGVAPRLDRAVVQMALAWLAAHPAQLAHTRTCSINLSGQSLGDDDFLEFVHRQIAEAGVPPHKICFEITETAAISNLASAFRFFDALRESGCRFALDDFGSGLSSFGYLKTLPVDLLKIDGVFVKGIVDDPVDHAMVRSIHEIGRVLGKQTVAEFVESEAILDCLREIGVDYAQGYHIRRPAPIEQLVLDSSEALLAPA